MSAASLSCATGLASFISLLTKTERIGSSQGSAANHPALPLINIRPNLLATGVAVKAVASPLNGLNRTAEYVFVN